MASLALERFNVGDEILHAHAAQGYHGLSCGNGTAERREIGGCAGLDLTQVSQVCTLEQFSCLDDR